VGDPLLDYRAPEPTLHWSKHWWVRALIAAVALIAIFFVLICLLVACNILQP
jgi:hypothetical protein